MSTRALRPWTDLVKVHPDVEGGALMKLLGHWRALIEQYLAADEGTPFEGITGDA